MPSRAENNHNAHWNEVTIVTCRNSRLSETLHSVRKLEVTLTELQYHTVFVMQEVQYERSVEVDFSVIFVLHSYRINNYFL